MVDIFVKIVIGNFKFKTLNQIKKKGISEKKNTIWLI